MELMKTPHRGAHQPITRLFFFDEQIYFPNKSLNVFNFPSDNLDCQFPICPSPTSFQSLMSISKESGFWLEWAVTTADCQRAGGQDWWLLQLQVDFNVPLDSDKNITNNQRIAGAVPTIKYAIDHGAKAVILMSHLGRPDGKVNVKYSLKPVVPELEKLLGGKKVEFAPDCVGKEVEEIVNKASGGQVVLLENLRFHAEEEGSSKDADGKKVKADKAKVDDFRKGLTALGDIYISKPLRD